MKSILLAFILVFTFACGGGGSSSPAPAPAPPPPPPQNVPTAIPRGTYRATSAAGMVEHGVVTPIGDIQQTLIALNDGNARLELSGWSQVRTSLYADAAGNLQISPDATMTNADGVTVPLTLTGTKVGNRLTGTTNGGPFDVTLTNIQDTVIDPATKGGDYLSTASSTGTVIRLHLPGVLGNSFNMTAEAYATLADAKAKVNQVANYSGTFGWSDGDTTHTRNCFNFGLLYAPGYSGSFLPGGVGGLAYFSDATTLVVLAVQAGDNGQTWNKQFSGVFVKE